MAVASFRLSKTSVIIGVLVLLSLSGYFIFKTFAATPTQANLWVDLSGGSCFRNPSPATYVNNQACGSIAQAWSAANSGDIIVIKADNYPAQAVVGDKTSPTYVIGEDGTRIGPGDLPCQNYVGRQVYGSDGAFCSTAAYLNLENVTIDSGTGKGKGINSLILKPNIIWRNVNLEGQYAAMGVDVVADNFTWQGGRHGAEGATVGPLFCHDLGAAGGGSLPIWLEAPNSVIDGLEIRPRSYIPVPEGSVEGCPDEVPHIETFRFEENADNITIKNTHMVEGSSAGSGHLFASTTVSGLKLINNYFGRLNATYWAQIQLECDSDTQFLYNTFVQASSYTCSGPNNILWAGNLNSHAAPGCAGTHIKNVWAGSGSCGTDTYVGSAPLGIDESTGLIDEDSPAVDAAETPSANDYCTGALVGSLDFEGTVRPRDSICDAGADEYGAPAPTAPTRYVSTAGSNASNDCLTFTSPCATLAYAYTQANAGDRIELAGGTYGNSSIGNRVLSGSPVIVEPARNATVNFTNIVVDTSNITIRGPNFNVRNFDIGNGGSSSTRRTDITLDDLNVDADDVLGVDAIWVGNTTNFKLRNSMVGNTKAGMGEFDTAKSVMTCAGNSTCHNINMEFDNNLFYDADTDSGSAAHLECIWAGGVQGFTLRNNVFRDCTIFDVFVTVVNANNQPQPTNHVFENNLFGQTIMSAGNVGGFGVSLHGHVDPEGFEFRHNTFEGALNMGEGVTTVEAGDWIVDSNIIAGGIQRSDSNTNSGCRPGTTVIYNVMPDECTEGDSNTLVDYEDIRSKFVSPKDPYAGADDFHLIAGSPAIDKGNPANASTTDRDGVYRANPPDAGAYEYTGSVADAVNPTVALTAPADGATVSGNVNITATATDNVGVNGVQFQVDGNNVGSDNSAPYTFSWDSATVANGAHTLTAVASDAANNSSASSRTVTVNNIPVGDLLVGNQNLEDDIDTLATQQTQAFPYVAAASGAAASVKLYIDASSTAQGAMVGLYSNSGGNPNVLLASATIANPTTGWNTVSLNNNPSIVSGTQYWIALLGTGSGTFAFRNKVNGPCISKVNITPNNWTTMKDPFEDTGATFTSCPASVYVVAAADLVGDLNADGFVDNDDRTLLIADYAKTSAQATTPEADLNGDGKINIRDLSILLKNWTG